ncbi:MAG TPA: CpsB/CapC family capsule biosynthesis tyrosine phosphatase [Pirellulales bacterium]|jgi:protein-tyrosine phosphatase
MHLPDTFVDIHCHILPGLDDGAVDLTESLAMARMAVEEGIRTIVCTPHQLGSFANRTDAIRRGVALLQAELHQAEVPLTVLPGADVRIEPDMVARLARDEILTLADNGSVLLELPHELYFSLESLVEDLCRAGYRAVLSHPERNAGILANPAVLEPLVKAGCLLQITSGSLLGVFGRRPQQLSEDLVRRRAVHCIATDAHDTLRRAPRMREAFQRAIELSNVEFARALCSTNPAAIATGQPLNHANVRKSPHRKKTPVPFFERWLSFGRTAR